MNFSEKLKTKRKEFAMSQEQLAEKIGVSRQAVTKWETEGGMPDIENILAIAGLFNTTVDELLSYDKELKTGTGFFHESAVEYDIDFPKHYDIHIGGAFEVSVDSNQGEKLYIRLASNAIASLEEQFKVKIDESKNKLDVDIRRGQHIGEAQAKEALFVFVSIPSKYVTGIEIEAHGDTLRLSHLQVEEIEFDGRINKAYLKEVEGFVDLNSSIDMKVVCDRLSGGVGINQINATSTLHIPKGTEYKIKKRGASNRISYTEDGKPSQAPTYPEADNIIKIAGLNMELVVNEYTEMNRGK